MARSSYWFQDICPCDLGHIWNWPLSGGIFVSQTHFVYTNLLAKIQEIHVGQQVIIAGDFNLIMDKEQNSMNHKNINNPKASLEVFNSIENLKT